MKSSIIKEKTEKQKPIWTKQTRKQAIRKQRKKKTLKKMTEAKLNINDDNEYKWVIPLS